ncbi:MAG: efflux RND transporter periplasmic adaptor subunit [Verrucomicrobia bacterium]|nr:efflux RND transporter periplasmic adaptor subunit [Verrucomicrobiota bacterium]MBU1733620.1 efflux RND transporter periplasmic adaptor subunit [Verrucomicrobiota bacterium]MBU1856794.1 efflux RND transporter periplasmic adaptor subunit [Verrucomicrobiota bacterium]
MKHIAILPAFDLCLYRLAPVMLLLFALGPFVGCGGKADASPQEQAPIAIAPDKPANAEKNKAAETKSEVTQAELLAERCEHKMLTHTCAECRYETGVVRIDQALLKTDVASTNGLILVEKVSKQTLAHSIEVSGEIRLNENESAHISPRIDGVIYAVRFDLGAKVAKGDVLFEIDSVELGNALNEYKKFQALADIARQTFEREKKLYDQKISSEQDMLTARAELEKSAADCQAAEHKLDVIGVNNQDLAGFLKDGPGRQAARLSVRSPISGTVIERHAAVGEVATAGKDVMLLSNLDTVWGWLNIYERDMAPLAARQAKGEKLPVRITVQAFPDMVFAGDINYLAATMREESRTVSARAIVQNRDGLLRPGMFCKATISVDAGVVALALPKAAVLSDEGQSFVFKHLKDDLYIRSVVTVGRENDGLVEIREGLSEGDLVVVEGAFILKSDVLREKMGAGCAD